MSATKNEEVNKLDVMIALVKIAGYGLFFCLFSVCLFARMLLEGDFTPNKFKNPDA